MLKVPALHFYKAKDRGTLQRQAGPTLFPRPYMQGTSQEPLSMGPGFLML